ncbi:MAG: hypothetical protein AAGJ35_15885, partial [Myxococcota bacterium]
MAQDKKNPYRVRNYYGMGASIFLLFLGLSFLGGAGYLFVESVSRVSEEQTLQFFMAGIPLLLGFLSLRAGGIGFLRAYRSPVGAFFLPVDFALLSFESDRIRVFPYLYLNEKKCQITHQHVNGIYTSTSVVADFMHYGQALLNLRGKEKAEGLLAQIFFLRDKVFVELEESQGRHVEGAEQFRFQERSFLKPPSRWKTFFRYTAVTTALVLVSYPAYRYFAEESAWSQTASRYDYSRYLRHYPTGRYVKQAQMQIEAFDFDAAKRKNTISAYRAYPKQYKPARFERDAKRRIKEQYTLAIQTYAQRLSPEERKTNLMLKMLRDLKRHDQNTIYIKFSPRFD